MIHTETARSTPRAIRARRIRVAVLLVVAAIAAAVSQQLPAASPSTAASPVDVPRSEHRGAPGVRGGATVFDEGVPAVAKLDSDLLDAVRKAGRDAAAAGVEFYVDSGWRSREHQERLRQEAISKHGSEAEAARWVATAETSPHVSGNAVDMPSDAAAWLSEHGAEYGLCQIYANEPWHYELRPEAIDHGCPAMYADPTHDPRMIGQHQGHSPPVRP